MTDVLQVASFFNSLGKLVLFRRKKKKSMNTFLKILRVYK